MGDLEGAAEAFTKRERRTAAARNSPPPVGPGRHCRRRRLDRLGTGRGGLEQTHPSPTAPRQVDIALAGGDIATAQTAITELVELADMFASPAILATTD